MGSSHDQFEIFHIEWKFYDYIRPSDIVAVFKKDGVSKSFR